jgi:hypothetical protein
MVPARRVPVTMAIAEGRAALGIAVLVLAACSGHSSAPVAASPAASSPSPAGSSPARSASPATTTAGAVHLPNHLLGLTRNTSAVAKQSVSYLSRKYVAPLTAILVSEKAAIYGGGQNGATPFFFVVAGELPAQITSPHSVAHKLQMSWSASGINNVKLFPEDPSGGPIVCGQTQNKDDMCSWVDHVSFGYVLYPPGFASSLHDAASKTSQIHSDVLP